MTLGTLNPDKFDKIENLTILRKFDVKIIQICPLQLSDVATLPWEIQKSHFQQYYTYILLIIYVISKENKL